jgi:hypothetical protein
MDDHLKSEDDSSIGRVAKLRRLARLAPRDPELRLALARELMRESPAEETITELRAVIALSPNHLEARKLLEKVLQRRSSQPI